MPTSFLLDLYRLAREAEAEKFPIQALTLLQRELPFDSGRWLRSVYREPGFIQVLDAHLFNDSDEMLKAHEKVIEQNWPNWNAVRCAELGPFGIAYNSAQAFGSSASAEIREYQRRYAHENTLNVLVKKRTTDGMRYRMIALHRARAERQFSKCDVSQMTLLMPHLVEALAINSVIANSARLACNSVFAMGIAEADGTLMFAEPRLRELLRVGWPAFKGGKVPAELWGELSRSMTFRGKDLVVAANVSGGWTFVRVRSACAADTLSRRELQVARLDSSGHMYKEISRLIGVAPATVRNQLQRVHEKLGARNRGEVTAALSLLG